MGSEDVKVTAMNMYKYKERLRLYKRWPCSTYILNRALKLKVLPKKESDRAPPPHFQAVRDLPSFVWSAMFYFGSCEINFLLHWLQSPGVKRSG